MRRYLLIILLALIGLTSGCNDLHQGYRAEQTFEGIGFIGPDKLGGFFLCSDNNNCEGR